MLFIQNRKGNTPLSSFRKYSSSFLPSKGSLFYRFLLDLERAKEAGRQRTSLLYFSLVFLLDREIFIKKFFDCTLIQFCKLRQSCCRSLMYSCLVSLNGSFWNSQNISHLLLRQSPLLSLLLQNTSWFFCPRRAARASFVASIFLLAALQYKCNRKNKKSDSEGVPC